MTDSKDVSDWRETSIIDMEPGKITFRGRPIEDLIGTVGFVQMIWWMVMGRDIAPAQAKLLEAVLVAAVDHGPQAPSLAAARMAATCGVGLNNAMATGLNMLGDVHGGAGEQAVELYLRLATAGPAQLVPVLDDWRTEHGRFIPGFGHRFHKPVDPRAPRLLALVDEAAQDGAVSGAFAQIARAIEAQLASERGKPAGARFV